MKFTTEVTALASAVSSVSPMAGVHITAGGRTGQELTAEHSNLTVVPSSTSSLDGVMVGLGSESEGAQTGSGRKDSKKAGVHVQVYQDKTGTLSGDDDARLEVELQVVVALQPEVVVVIMLGRQVHEDGGAVLVPQVPRQVPLQEVQAGARPREAGVEHLRSAPAASPPNGSARTVQVLIPDRRHAERAGDHHARSAQALHRLGHEGSPVLTAAP